MAGSRPDQRGGGLDGKVRDLQSPALMLTPSVAGSTPAPPFTSCPCMLQSGRKTSSTNLIALYIPNNSHVKKVLTNVYPKCISQNETKKFGCGQSPCGGIVAVWHWVYGQDSNSTCIWRNSGSQMGSTLIGKNTCSYFCGALPWPH